MSESEQKTARMLVKVETADWPRYEWRDVPGYEIKLPSTPLKNGDTLTIEYTMGASDLAECER